jgi:dienelactone hydrolase
MRLALLLLLGAALAGAQPDPRREALEVLLNNLPSSNPKITGRITAVDKTWEEWQRRTGELPPDFSRLKPQPFLPDPLEDVRSEADWRARRAHIKAQFEQWVYGKFPPAPGNLRAVVTGERVEDGITVRDVRLEFGPGHRATLRLQVLIPPGAGPKPVFLTNHPRTRPWVATAVRRGYIGCIYFATDPMYGNTDDSDAWIEIYPEYDFSCIARWAWAAMRAVDYLVTLQEVDAKKIAITGHSRNGKQALAAAAFDERIGALALSSGNTGEGNPWRYTSDPFVNESIEQITGNFPHWFHPRLRFFAGREHLLPVDQNQLMALMAPRGLLLASAYAESQGSPFGFEQAYRSVREVYRYLGAPEMLGLSLRAGEHATTAEDIERYVDFFDHAFGRRAGQRPETWVLGFNYERWRALSTEVVDLGAWPRRTAGETKDRAAVLKNLRWTLGEEPPGVAYPNRTTLEGVPRTSEGWLGGLYERPLKAEGMASTGISFGDDLKADLYYPARRSGPLPAVIWLHPFSYATGYSRGMAPFFAALTKAGFAVLAFDQVGFGSRLFQAERFYERYPRWSMLGKMVADTRAAVSALAALEVIDSRRIYLAGWSLGSKVGLYTAALDERLAGLAVVGGLAALRLDKPAYGAEGVRQYAQLHGLLPRLGAFAGEEARLPVDDPELLALLAPRPVLWIAPELDRYSPIAGVRAAAVAGVTLETPKDFLRLPRQRQTRLVEWLAGEAAKGAR